MTRPLRLPAVTVTTRHSPSVYPWQASVTVPRGGVAGWGESAGRRGSIPIAVRVLLTPTNAGWRGEVKLP